MTAPDDAAVWRRLRGGDRSARAELAALHAPLVRAQVGRFARLWAARAAPLGSISLDDLGAAGAVALVKAIDRYDPCHERRASFAHFAIPRIRGAMLDTIRAAGPPRLMVSRALEYQRVYDELRAELGAEPTETDMAAAMGISIAAVRRRWAEASRGLPVSLDTPRPFRDDDDDDHDDNPQLADPKADVEASALQAELGNELRRVLARLDPRRRAVFLRRAVGEQAESIARDLGVSPSRVTQLERSARHQLATLILEARP